jgi:DNA-binding transcriptional LysR family regulator
MLDRLTSLEVFVRVASSGSLSAAGRSMGLSQSMVTKHLAALEARLGVSLFHRTTRRLSITDAGRNYLESAERILGEFDAANSSVAADRFEPRGMLRLNVPVSFGTRHCRSSRVVIRSCRWNSVSMTGSSTSRRKAGTWRCESAISPIQA